MVLTPEGNVVICSNTQNFRESILIKINFNGGVIWSKEFGFSGFGVSLINDPQGGYIVTGTNSSVINSSGILAFKTDSVGNIIWSKSYNPASVLNHLRSGFGYQIIPCRSGGYLLTGRSQDTKVPSGSGTSNFVVIRIDENGKLIWSNTYNNQPLTLEGWTLIELPDKSIYVGGLADGSNNNGSLLKLDSTGKFLWHKIYQCGTFYFHFCMADYDKINNVLNFSVLIAHETGLVRLDTSGNVIFAKNYGTNLIRNDVLHCAGHNFIRTTGGDFIILQSNNINILGGSGYDFHLLKTDSLGNTNGCSTSSFSLNYYNLPLSSLYSFASMDETLKTDTGCTVAIIKLNENNYCPPFVAGFGWKNPCNSQQTFFYDSSYYKATSWHWDFGDPGSSSNTSTKQNQVHIYAKPGKYLVKLIAGNGSVTDSIIKVINIFPLPLPFRYDTIICQGNTISLKASGGVTYQWHPAQLVSDPKSANPITSPKRTMFYTVNVSSGNACTIIDTIKVTVDNKPSPPVITFATVVSNNEIDVQFQKSDSNDVKYYFVYRSVNDSSYRQIATFSNNIFASGINYLFKDSTVKANENTYSYKILAVDSCGVASDTSIAHQPVLFTLNPIGCKTKIQIKWTDYLGWGNVNRYLIYRSIDGANYTLLTAFFKKQNTFIDSGLDYHKSYCYKIIAYDNTGQYTSTANIACGNVFFPDTAKIINVTKLSTSLVSGSVVIHIRNINKPNYAGSKLYYSPDGKNFTFLITIPPAQDSFVHNGVNTETTDQYYYLTSVDSCGQESVKSDVHKTMNLTVSVGQLLHKLNWTPYVGFKVKNYIIQRLVKGQFQSIDTVPGTDTFSKEFPAPCNFNIRYRITALGNDSGQISWSDSMGREAIDTIPSDAPKFYNATVLNSTLTQLKFIGSDSLDTYKFAIQRSINGNWTTIGNILFTKPDDSLLYNDNIQNGVKNKICYTIIALDSCLNATPTDTICAVNLDINALACTKQVQLKWTTCSGKAGCPDNYLIYRSTDGIIYTQIQILNGNFSGYTDTAIILGNKYYYNIEALNINKKANSFSDTVSAIPTLIPEAGNAQFVYATILKTDPKSGQVFIQWKRAAPTDTNARGYYLYTYDTVNKKYALLKDITDLNDTTYIHPNLNTLQGTYKYYIITYNVCDVGAYSNIHKTILLTINNGNLSANLHWTNYLGETVNNYSVYKSDNGGKPILLKDAGNDTTYNDTNIYCNHTYTYQIQAVLDNGKISFSDSVTIKAYDTIKPKTNPISLATVLKTGSSDGKILLSWQAAEPPLGGRGQGHGSPIAGYNIDRSNDGIVWNRRLSGYRGLTLTDSILNTYGQPYYYRVQAVDSCGNVGAFTNFHKTINLKATAGNQFIQLNWNKYLGWKVKKYLLYRDNILIASIGKDTINFKDTLTVCTQMYHYLVKAICDTTNDTLISASNIDSIKSFDHKAPQKVYIKTVTVSNPNKEVTISWNPSPSFDTKNYVIYRKSGITGNMTLIDTTSQTTYLDTNSAIREIQKIRDSDGDCYYVFAQDHCGNISPGSNEGCIIILNAKNETFYNDLNWNGYQTWYDGVLNYNVYKNEDNQGWNLIGTTSNGNIRNFTDKDLGDSTINFCYQVEAIENPGQWNQLSRSTVACVHQGATVFIPNTFSHYHIDGLNDYFGPKGLYIKNYTMQIYNRWGELVFNTNSGQQWDGTFRGQDALEGVYIYLITVEDYNGKHSTFKGNITIFK